MTPLGVIVASTRLAAEVLILDQLGLGTVVAGKSADFVVLDANPWNQISNIRKISRVYLRGQEVDRAAMRPRWQAQWATSGLSAQ
jgi:imidazolonepropionase-like amidohydrolase